eukprot:m.285628 g.285628  ORF g.285628 m.285628 type:complete len:70 (-) comp54977_c0_seq6:71-280(-)
MILAGRSKEERTAFNFQAVRKGQPVYAFFVLGDQAETLHLGPREAANSAIPAASHEQFRITSKSARVTS